MATELESLRTFLGLVHTVATAKYSPEEATKVSDIVDASFQRILVHPPEIIGVKDSFITKRYKVEVSETSEANLSTALNNIMIGIDDFNGRQVITGWTYATYPKMCHMKLAKGGKTVIRTVHDRADIDIWIDIEWSTS